MQAELNNAPPSKLRRGLAPTTITDINFRRPGFPSFDFLLPLSKPHAKRQNSTLTSSDAVIESFATYGPLFSRLINEHTLASPMFVTTLQRDTLDIGGNMGMLSIGELPAGIKSDSLTWVPIRAYTAQEGGLPPSPAAPNEVSILHWAMTLVVPTESLAGIPSYLGNCHRRCLLRRGQAGSVNALSSHHHAISTCRHGQDQGCFFCYIHSR